MARTTGLVLCVVGTLTLLACGGSGGDREVIRIPTLIGSDPADGATGVPVSTFVDLLWEQALDPATVTAGHVALRAPSGPVPGTLSYDAPTRRIRFVPDEDLVLGTRYTAHVNPGLADVDGRVLETAWDVTFRVETAAPISTQLLETEAIADARFGALALNDEGRGFAVWTRSPPIGDATLRATPFDTASGRGTPVSLGSASIIGTDEYGVAVNEAGDAVVAWMTQDGTDDVWARIYRAGIDAWSIAQKLNVTPGESARDVRVGIDADANVHAVWSQQAGFGDPEDLWYRWYGPGVGWGAAARVELVAGAARGARVAVHPSGTACVAWHQQAPTNFNIYARTYDPTTGWSVVELLEPDDTTRALEPQIAIAPSGDILVCWYQEEGAAHSDDRTWANTFIAGGGPGSGWQGPVLLRDDAGDHRGMQLVMDASGNAIVAWQRYVNPNHYVFSRRLPAGGTWEDVVTLSNTSTANIDSWSLQLATPPTGRAMAVWAQSAESGASRNLHARAFVAGAGWGTTSTVATGGVDWAPSADLAVDHEGNSIVIWRTSVYDGAGAFIRTDAWSNRYGLGSGWAGAALLEDDEVSNARNLAVHMDRYGRGVVIWEQDRAGGPEGDLYYTISR